MDFCRDQTGFFLDLDIRECETMNMRNGLPQIKTNILAPKVPFRIYAGLRDPIMLLDPEKLDFLRTKNPSEYRFYPSATPPDAIAIWPPGPYHEHGGDIDMIIKGAQSWLYGMQAKREGK